jgi:hypothetical protein
VLREQSSNAAEVMREAEGYLDAAAGRSFEGGVIASQIAELREQIQQVYEIIGLGLTAEALSHEVKGCRAVGVPLPPEQGLELRAFPSRTAGWAPERSFAGGVLQNQDGVINVRATTVRVLDVGNIAIDLHDFH